MPEKRVTKFHEEFKLFGFIKLWESTQSSVDYFYEMDTDELEDEILLKERIKKLKKNK